MAAEHAECPFCWPIFVRSMSEIEKYLVENSMVVILPDTTERLTWWKDTHFGPKNQFFNVFCESHIVVLFLDSSFIGPSGSVNLASIDPFEQLKTFAEKYKGKFCSFYEREFICTKSLFVPYGQGLGAVASELKMYQGMNIKGSED